MPPPNARRTASPTHGWQPVAPQAMAITRGQMHRSRANQPPGSEGRRCSPAGSLAVMHAATESVSTGGAARCGAAFTAHVFWIAGCGVTAWPVSQLPGCHVSRHLTPDNDLGMKGRGLPPTAVVRAPSYFAGSGTRTVPIALSVTQAVSKNLMWG